MLQQCSQRKLFVFWTSFVRERTEAEKEDEVEKMQQRQYYTLVMSLWFVDPVTRVFLNDSINKRSFCGVPFLLVVSVITRLDRALTKSEQTLNFQRLLLDSWDLRLWRSVEFARRRTEEELQIERRLKWWWWFE